MRLLAKTLVALGFVGAIGLGAATPAPAQGIYFDAPGVEFGFGAPRYRYRHYGYDPYWSYGYRHGYDRPYYRRYHRWHDWD
jgi:hypothetical protein